MRNSVKVTNFLGILCLSDCSDIEGGFCCVPGFQKHIEEWSTLMKDTSYCKENDQKFDFFSIPAGKNFSQKIPKMIKNLYRGFITFIS